MSFGIIFSGVVKEKKRKNFLVYLLILSVLSIQLLPLFIPEVYAASSSWTQTDWSGGNGQAAFNDASKYLSESTIDNSTEGQLTLAKNEKFQNTGFESDLSSWTEVPSYILNDQFASTAPTTLVSGGLSAPTPIMESELMTNGNMESGSPPTGWTAGASATLTSEPDERTGGSGTKSLGIRNSVVNFGTARSSATTVIGSWYQLSVWTKRLSDGAWRAWDGTASWINMNQVSNGNSITTWSQKKVINRATTTSTVIYVTPNTNTLNDQIYFDDVSLVPLTLSSLFTTTAEGTTNKIISTGVTLTSGTQAGVVVNLDSASSPSNFVIAYHDGTTAHLDKSVGGVYTSLISTAATYSAGATMKVIKKGNVYKLIYNGAQIGADQTVSDAGIVDNTLQGIFSTYASNSFTNFLITTNLDGTSAQPTGGARTVTDTNGKMSVGSGVLNFATGEVVNEGVWYPSQSRLAGKILMGKIILNDTTAGVRFGWDTETSGNINDAIIFGSTAITVTTNNASNVGITTFPSATTFDVAVVMRSTGMYFFIKGGNFTNWTLVYISSLGTNAGLPSLNVTSTNAVFTFDDVRIPTATWLPTPLAYSTFGTPGATATDITGPDNQTTSSLSLTGGVVTGGTLSITPSMGDELNTNTGMETGSPPTGWIGTTGTLTSVSDERTGGSGAQSSNLASTGVSATLDQGNKTVAIGTWLSANGWVKNTVNSSARYMIQEGTNPWAILSDVRVSSSAWTNAVTTARATQTTIRGRGYLQSSGDQARFDDFSFKPLSLPSLFSTVSTSDTNVLVDADVTVSAGTQAGLALDVDSTENPSNFILVYTDGTYIKVDEVVNGVYTNKQTTAHGSVAALNYAAGRTLRAIKDGNKLRVYYNNTSVGSELTMTANTNTKHGMFSTYSGNTFDNFVVWPKKGFSDAPFEELTVTRDTVTKYAGVASTKLVALGTDANYLQSVTVGDTDSYNISAYVYTGAPVTTNDINLYAGTSIISTTFTPVDAGQPNGWYLITGTTTGSITAKDYGVRVKAGKTVYVDNMSLYTYSTGSLTSSVYDAGIHGGEWGTFTYNAATPIGTSITVKVRTANAASMNSATDFGSCTALSDGEDLSGNSCVTDGDRYIQYQVALDTTSTLLTPSLSDITINFTEYDNVGPVVDVDAPGNYTYTNNERPTFRWKQAVDEISDVVDYDLVINNPSTGSNQPSGDFTVSDIPLSGYSDYTTHTYVVRYDGFDDSDTDNNYISLTTKSHPDWSIDQNDGKLREGTVHWKLVSKDSVGNSTESHRTLFVDRHSPSVQFTQVNDRSVSGEHIVTTDKTPTIYGKLTDDLSGGDVSQPQDENGPGVSSGPKQVEITVEKKNGFVYTPISIYTHNFDTSIFTCDSQEVVDNSKQPCAKYSLFEYVQKNDLEYGTYKITATGIDDAGNVSRASFNLTVESLADITTPIEKQVIHDFLKDQPQKIQEQVNKELEITKPAGPTMFDAVKLAFRQAVQSVGTSFFSAYTYLGRTYASIENFAGSTFSGIGQAVPTAFTGVATTFIRNMANLTHHSSGVVSDISDFVTDRSAAIHDFAGKELRSLGSVQNHAIDAIKHTSANLVFTLGEKAQGVSQDIGNTIITFGYIFVPEPTRISHVQVEILSSTSAKISWKTNHPANGKVNYGLDETYPMDVQSEKRTTDHEFILTNLTPETEYSFEVMSQNKNYVYDANRKFKTPKAK